MKNILNIILQFLIFCSTIGCGWSNNVEKVTAKIKSIKEITYDAEQRFGEVIKTDKKYAHTYNYNKLGKIVESTDIKFGPLDFSKSIFTYNESDSLIDESTYDKKGELKAKTIINYSQYGLKEVKRIRKSEFVDIRKYKYNENNNLIEETYYSPERNHKWSYKYNSLGQEVETILENNGTLSSRNVIVYNDKGEMTAKYDYDHDYDENGILTHKTLFSKKDGKTYLTHYNRKYPPENGSLKIWRTEVIDKSNNLLEIIDYDGLLEVEKSTLKYDSHGNKIESIWIQGENITKYSITYKYNSNGDWTEKVEFEDHIAKSVTEREIEYFE